MAGTLDITIDNGVITYSLQVEELTVDIRRSPLQAPMPDADPVQIDLGFYDPSVSIRGILEIEATTDGTNVIPSKDNLEDAALDWTADTVTLSIPSTSSDYEGKISAFSATLVSGKEHVYWTFRLDMIAKRRT